jgi:hypothetical protein
MKIKGIQVSQILKIHLLVLALFTLGLARGEESLHGESAPKQSERTGF